jgi:hypothetical protein
MKLLPATLCLGLMVNAAHAAPSPSCDDPASGLCDIQPAPPSSPVRVVPGTAPLTPTRPAPASCDLEDPRAVAPRPLMVYAPMPVVASRPPSQLSVALGVSSGVTAFQYVSDSSKAAAFVGGDLRLLWTRADRSLSLGLRLGFSAGVNMSMDGVPSGASDSNVRVYNMEAGFLMSFSGFWWTAGLAFSYFDVPGHDETTVPALNIGVGYDIALGDHLAIRLQASGSTFILVNQGQLGAGLVARF